MENSADLAEIFINGRAIVLATNEDNVAGFRAAELIRAGFLTNEEAKELISSELVVRVKNPEFELVAVPGKVLVICHSTDGLAPPFLERVVGGLAKMEGAKRTNALGININIHVVPNEQVDFGVTCERLFSCKMVELRPGTEASRPLYGSYYSYGIGEARCKLTVRPAVLEQDHPDPSYGRKGKQLIELDFNFHHTFEEGEFPDKLPLYISSTNALYTHAISYAGRIVKEMIARESQ